MVGILHTKFLQGIVMYALCVVYNPSNPHLALGPVCRMLNNSCCILMQISLKIVLKDLIANKLFR